MGNTSFGDLVHALTSGSLGPELRPIVVIASVVFNLIWFAFVGALVARHTAYMAGNITTYEVLVRPAHVQRRFPKNRGRFWFLQGCDPFSSVSHCFNYWTLSTQTDTTDFMGTVGPSEDSFVNPGQDEDEGGRGKLSFDTAHGGGPGHAFPGRTGQSHGDSAS